MNDLETIKEMLTRAGISFEESVPYKPHGGALQVLAEGASIIELQTESGVSFFFRREGDSDSTLAAMWSR